MSTTGSERVGRSRAGPSKRVAKPRRKQVVEDEESEEPEVAEIVHDSGDDEVMLVDPPPKTRKPASQAATKSGAKGKGKAKEESAPTKKQPPRADIDMVTEDDEDAVSATARAINDAVATNGHTVPPKRVATSTATTKQIESLRRQLETAQAHIKDLAKQLEESYRVRHTEPEELQIQQAEKYDQVIRSKDAIIKQQEEMLARKEPLSKEGKTSVLHLVTREHADAEKRSAEEQVAHWKRQVDDRDRIIAEKDKRIADLIQTESDLQYEIKTERENNQKNTRNPPSALRGRGPNAVLGSDDPKHSELVRFYEDVTNLLVTDIKMQEPKFFKLDECSMTCIYTYEDKTASEESRRSLGFILRFTYDPLDPSVPIENEDDLDKAAQYTPLNLDKEKPEFIEALQFLNTGFTFPRKQLPLFYNSLVTNMKAACEPEQSEPGSELEDTESMQDVEVVE
ncbi:hypothetical protein R3P38DRAFT_2969447 [Favolaschia claudopus]|uniref:Monopolin complex subunit Csm1/Pcs1 C-terminal domain-containing protein n=1 Tax=Favolaschia claudopus TaxID=2862362 RepID=A0AAW0B610_9AGAR